MSGLVNTTVSELLTTFLNRTEVVDGGSGFVITETSKTIMYIIYSLVFFFGVLGNGTVVYVVGLKSKDKTTSNTLMTSLAIADLLAAIFIPFVMVNDLAVHKWHFGAAMCKILPSFNCLTLVASAWSMVIIAVDRCRVIRNPFQAFLSPAKRGCCIAFVWGLAICTTFPYSYVLDVQDEFCWDFWETSLHQFMYFTALEAMVCFFPTLIMAAAYSVSVYALYQNELSFVGNATDLKRNQQNKRVTKMFAVVVAAFFLLTTPYLMNAFFLTYYAAFDEEYYTKHKDLFLTLNYGLFTLSAINSCINPFVYARMHPSIRKFVLEKFIKCLALPCCKESAERRDKNIRGTMKASGSRRGSGFDNASFTSEYFVDASKTEEKSTRL